MKIQKGIVYNIHLILPRITDLKSPKLIYVISKLLNITEDEYDAISKAMRPSREFLEFQNKYQLINNDNTLTESEKTEKINNLINEYQDIIKEREEQLKHMEEILRTEIELNLDDLPKISLNEIPEGFPIEAMRILDKLDLVKME